MTLPARKSFKKSVDKKRSATPDKKKTAAAPQQKKPLSGLHESVGNHALEKLYSSRKREEKKKEKRGAKEAGRGKKVPALQKKEPKVEAEAELKLPAPKAAAAPKLQKPKALKLHGASEKMVADFATAPASLVAATYPVLGKRLTKKVEEERAETFKNAPKLTAALAGESSRRKGGFVKVRTSEKEEFSKGPQGERVEELKVPEHRNFGAAPKNEKSLQRLEKTDRKKFIEWFKAHFFSFVNSIRTTDPGLNTKAQMDTRVKLEGESDPKRAENDKAEAQRSVAKRRDSEVESFVKHPGQSQIRPKEVNEAFEVPAVSKEGEPIGSAEDEGMKGYLEAEIPKDVRDRADELLKPVIEEGLKKLNKETADSAKKRDENKRREESSKKAEAEKLNRRAQREQEEAVAAGRKNVAGEQQKGVDEAHRATRAFAKESDEEQRKTKSSISKKVKDAEAEAKKEVQKGENQAKKLKEEGEERARRKKKELESKQKKKSWWDRAVDAIKSAVKAITKAIDKIFTEIRDAVKKAIDAAKKLAISVINKARKFILSKLEAFRKWAKKMVNRYVKKFFPALAKRINRAIDRFVDRAKKVVNKVADGLIAGVKALADALSKALDKILSAFQTALKAAVQIAGAVLTGNFSEALKIAIQAACDIAGIDSKPIFGFIRRAGALFAKILKSPRKFFNNLVEAVGGGVRNFAKNIKKHLISGLFAWLTGVLSEAKIELPKKFDAKGIFTLAMQILGLTYANIKARIIRKFPRAAGVIDKIEKGFEIIKELVTKGPAALWKRVSSMLRNFKESVISGVRNFVITTLVKEGILWLLSLLNPASAIVKVIKLLYDFIMFLVESFDQIKAFVLSVYNSIAAIAAGSLGPAKKAVEMSLARILPVVINLLARLAGLGGIAKTVRKIIAKVSRPVNRVIDKIIDKAVAFAKKLLGKGKRGIKKIREKAKKIFRINRRIGKPIAFTAAKERHRLWVDRKRGRVVPMAASRPQPIASMLARWEKKLRKLPESERKEAKAHIAAARTHLELLNKRAEKEERDKRAALKDNEVTEQEAKRAKTDESATVAAEKGLSAAIVKLLETFDSAAAGLQKRFEKEIEQLHPAFRPLFLVQLSKVKDVNKVRGWDDLKKRVMRVKKIGIFQEKPLSRTHLYGRTLQKHEALEAFGCAKKAYAKELGDDKAKKLDEIDPMEFISGRIGTIHTRKAPHTDKAYNTLQEYLFDKSKRDDVVAGLKAYYFDSLKGSAKKEHKEYEPKIPEDGMKLENNVFEIEYTYEAEEHKEKHFRVRFDFAKINTHREMTQSVKGENLALKLRGSRGKTDRSGELAKFDTKGKKVDPRTILIHYFENKGVLQKRGRKIKTMTYEELLDLLSEKERRLFRKVDEKYSYLQKEQKFDSAHLVADWFGGSGYRKALNLVVTSAQYNRVVMKEAEDTIVNEVNKRDQVEDKKSGVNLFDLTVTATWDVLQDSELKSKINEHSILKQLGGREPKPWEERKELAKGAQEALYNILSSKQDPRRVLRVRYEGKIKKPANEELERVKIGCDIWMSAFFKFEKKEKCFL